MKDEIPDFSSHIDIEVPFHDVDSMRVVWHGHYTKYFELARCKLLESFDYGYTDMFESGYSWPVVDMRLKYVKSAYFGQVIRVEASLKEWRYRLKINYRITDAESGEKITSGYTSQVAIDLKTNEMCYQSPDVLAQRLGIEP
ncbi:MAG: acyl-CoA thioesterase [Halioglobus sp.]